MADLDLVASYNYDSFVPEKFQPWMRFGDSPPLAEAGPDFPLWTLEGAQTSLSALWDAHAYLVVEFGSFT